MQIKTLVAITAVLPERLKSRRQATPNSEDMKAPSSPKLPVWKCKSVQPCRQ